MDWQPLRLSAPVPSYDFGAPAIPDWLCRAGLESGRIAETWEVGDVAGAGARVLDGTHAGRTLREITLAHPEAVVGRGWDGPHCPLLATFIDGAGMLPVHLQADEAAARRLKGAPHGKTEAWHILDAAPGATALVGSKPVFDREIREPPTRAGHGRRPIAAPIGG